MDFRGEYKSFLDFLLGLAFISLSLIYQSSLAKDLSYLSELSKDASSIESNYIFGVDSLGLSVKSNTDYDRIFKSTKFGGNFYVGYNWQDSIVFEVGYLFTDRKSKSDLLVANTNFLSAKTTTLTTVNGKVRFKNTNVNLNFITKINNRVNVITSFGVGFIRPHITFTAVNFATGNIINYQSILSKTSAIFRAGFGVSYGLTKNFGIRTLAYFDNYYLIKLRQPAAMDRPFKNAYTLLVGMFCKLI